MTTFELFLEFYERNLTESMRSWSKVWLGRAQNFATTHQYKPLPPGTAIRLWHRLIEAEHHDLAAGLLASILEDDGAEGAHD